MRKTLLSLGLFALFVAPSVSAQSACSGTLTRVRVSSIKKGMMEQFKQAVAANLAWYRGKGVTTNNIVMAPLMDYNSADKDYKLSTTEAMVFHYNPPQASTGAPVQDEAYKAFVKMYNESSTIEQEYTICMPATRPGSTGLQP